MIKPNSDLSVDDILDLFSETIGKAVALAQDVQEYVDALDECGGANCCSTSRDLLVEWEEHFQRVKEFE